MKYIPILAISLSLTIAGFQSFAQPSTPTATAATNIASTSFNANWNGVSGGLVYFLDVSTSPTFSSFVSGYNNYTQTGTGKSITGLVANTTYYYRVRVATSAGTSGNSNTITVVAKVPPVATAATAIGPTSFTAHWNAFPGATGYRLDVSASSTFSSFVLNNQSISSGSTSYIVSSGLTAGTTYYYRLRAISSSGTSANSNVISCVTAVPTPVAPVAIAASAITSSSFTINWNAVSGAANYRVDVATSSDFSAGNIVYNNLLSSGTGTSININNLTLKTSYYYRVRAENAGGISPNSNTIFVINLDHNYVRSIDVTVAGKTDLTQVENATFNERITNYAFVDGLGRPIQNVTMQGSPSQKDIVQPISYDGHGRENKKYLPYTDESNGWYKENALKDPTSTETVEQNIYRTGKQYVFYQSGDVLASDQFPYAETRFEPSPLNRVLEQGAPGNAWQPDGTDAYTSTDRTIKQAYESNIANEVLLWTYTYPTSSYPLGLVNASTGATPIYYPANKLFRNKTKDEEYHEVIEYKDLDGKVILKKVQAPNYEWAQTYYIYDDFGNLVCVLPPEATKAILKTPTSEYFNQSDPTKESFLSRWAFRYTYDSRMRMSQKQVPGAGAVYMVYDNRDRLILTQDANQRSGSPRYWTFTKYDELNRPILTGIKDTVSLLTQSAMQTVVNDYYTLMTTTKPWRKWGETYIGVTAPNNVHGYSNYSYPQVTTTANLDVNSYLTVTYYDNYNFRSDWQGTYAYINDGLSKTVNGVLYSQPTTEFLNVIGQVTGTKVKVLDGYTRGGYTWLKSINYYDDHYRVIQNQQDNYKGGRDVASNLYDFVGEILKAKVTHSESDVNWVNVQGAEVTGNKLIRAAAGNSWTASGAASQQQLPAGQDGWMEFIVSETTTNRMIGLADTDPSLSYTGIDYAFYLNGGILKVYQNGSAKTTIPGALVPGEVLRIERNGTTITYKRNGQTVYTSTVASTTLLMVDVSLNTSNATLVGVKTSFGNTSHTIARSFDYDHAGRLLKTWHQIDAQPEILLSSNTYNELGQLVDKNLHSTDNGTTFKQSVDYRYNIRGWLTSMNDAALTLESGEPKDFFGMELGYNNDVGTGNASLYNGNISAMKWSNNMGFSDVKEKAYNYSYDAMNRITGATFKEKTTSYALATNSGFSENNYQYDLNGNIKRLVRYDKRGTTTVMDDLTYLYGPDQNTPQSNMLLKVGDAGDKAFGFADGTNTGDDYTYDVNGNLTNDENKGLTTSTSGNAITYNFLNLPETVIKGGTGGNNVRYIYDASGKKLSQIVTFGGIQKQTDYAGEFVYENDVLQFINHEEGRMVMMENKLVYTDACDAITTLAASNSTLTAHINGNEKYVKITSSGTATQTGATFTTGIPVNAGERYRIRVKSYRDKGTAASSSAAYIHAQLNGSDINWPGATLPVSSTTALTETWVEQIVTASASGVLEAGVAWNTVLAGEAIYLNEIEITRLTESTTPEYQYHLKDHLGNVRLTFTTKDLSDPSCLATMEPANRTAEAGKFVNYDRVRIVNSQAIFDHTNDPGTANVGSSIRLSGNANEKTGLIKTLAVMPGDVVQMEVYAKYLDTEQTNWTEALASLVSSISSGSVSVVTDGASYNTNASNPFPFTGLNGTSNSAGAGPKAYLNYIMFDKDFNPVLPTVDPSQTFYVRMSTAAKEDGQTNPPNGKPHELLTATVTVKQPGYMYIYLSNEETSPVEVYFDDFKVTHTKTPVIQMDDYYPFGLAYNSYTRENTIAQDFKYNGKELQDELSLGWLDYGARMYMPELGRWGTLDPLADRYYKFSPYVYVGNVPTVAIDPDGKKILFVNGYWNSWVGGIIGSSTPGKEYWGSGFTEAAQNFFGDYSKVSESNYIDGSSWFGGDSSGGGREEDGYEYAKNNYSSLIEGLEEDETFKLVTHSEGGAFGAGIARYLIEKGHNVESILHLSPDEGDEFETPEEPTTYELSYGGDWVTGNKEISKGVDISGIVDKFSSKSDKAQYSHGSTKGSGVFKEVKALLAAAASGATGVKVTETKSGVKFEIIRDNRKKEDDKK